MSTDTLSGDEVELKLTVALLALSETVIDPQNRWLRHRL